MGANFNLAYMHQFGIGVNSSTPQARRYYHRCVEVDPVGVQTPVVLMLTLLSVQAFLTELPSAHELAIALLSDLRTHVLAIHLFCLVVLLCFRRSFMRAAVRVPAVATLDTGFSTSLDQAAATVPHVRRTAAGRG